MFQVCITVHFAYSSIAMHMRYIPMGMGIILFVAIVVIIITTIINNIIITGVPLQIYACPIYDDDDDHCYCWGAAADLCLPHL